MADFPIRQAFRFSYHRYCRSGAFQSDVQRKAAYDLMACKSGAFGCNVSICGDCGHTEFHHNSCRNRNCPNCQALTREIWVDKRREEVIDAPYFHVVFTLPHELNPLRYSNQKLLYGLFHKCCAETLLELSANPKHLGAAPGIIQVLHTWNQELDYHVHMHYDKQVIMTSQTLKPRFIIGILQIALHYSLFSCKLFVPYWYCFLFFSCMRKEENVCRTISVLQLCVQSLSRN